MRWKELLSAQRRVGVRPEDRLAWAAAFSRRGPNTMTHGGWLNVQTEPATLLAGEPGSPFQGVCGE